MVDDKTELDPEDDAAYVNWGPEWRMPTMEQQQELIEKCTWTYHKLNGVEGRLVTGPNGKTIFLPATGSFNEGTTVQVGESYGIYWSRSLYTSSPIMAYYMDFLFDTGAASCVYFYRPNAHSVRAVRVP